jgi:hypothetical protein
MHAAHPQEAILFLLMHARITYPFHNDDSKSLKWVSTRIRRKHDALTLPVRIPDLQASPTQERFICYKIPITTLHSAVTTSSRYTIRTILGSIAPANQCSEAAVSRVRQDASDER